MGRPKKNRKKLQYTLYEWILSRNMRPFRWSSQADRLIAVEALSCET
jgi:hypothetical protein